MVDYKIKDGASSVAPTSNYIEIVETTDGRFLVEVSRVTRGTYQKDGGIYQINVRDLDSGTSTSFVSLGVPLLKEDTFIYMSLKGEIEVYTYTNGIWELSSSIDFGFIPNNSGSTKLEQFFVKTGIVPMYGDTYLFYTHLSAYEFSVENASGFPFDITLQPSEEGGYPEYIASVVKYSDTHIWVFTDRRSFLLNSTTGVESAAPFTVDISTPIYTSSLKGLRYGNVFVLYSLGLHPRERISNFGMPLYVYNGSTLVWDYTQHEYPDAAYYGPITRTPDGKLIIPATNGQFVSYYTLESTNGWVPVLNEYRNYDVLSEDDGSETLLDSSFTDSAGGIYIGAHSERNSLLINVVNGDVVQRISQTVTEFYPEVKYYDYGGLYPRSLSKVALGLYGIPSVRGVYRFVTSDGIYTIGSTTSNVYYEYPVITSSRSTPVLPDESHTAFKEHRLDRYTPINSLSGNEVYESAYLSGPMLITQVKDTSRVLAIDTRDMSNISDINGLDIIAAHNGHVVLRSPDEGIQTYSHGLLETKDSLPDWESTSSVIFPLNDSVFYVSGKLYDIKQDMSVPIHDHTTEINAVLGGLNINDFKLDHAVSGHFTLGFSDTATSRKLLSFKMNPDRSLRDFSLKTVSTASRSISKGFADGDKQFFIYRDGTTSWKVGIKDGNTLVHTQNISSNYNNLRMFSVLKIDGKYMVTVMTDNNLSDSDFIKFNVPDTLGAGTATAGNNSVTKRYVPSVLYSKGLHYLVEGSDRAFDFVGQTPKGTLHASLQGKSILDPYLVSQITNPTVGTTLDIKMGPGLFVPNYNQNFTSYILGFSSSQGLLYRVPKNYVPIGDAS